MKKQRLNEGFFDQIAKLLSLGTIQTSLSKTKEMVDCDPELTKTIQDLKDGYDRLKSKLPDFCKRHPQSNLCKDNKGKSKD